MKTGILIAAIATLALAGCTGVKEDPRSAPAATSKLNPNDRTNFPSQDAFNPALPSPR